MLTSFASKAFVVGLGAGGGAAGIAGGLLAAAKQAAHLGESVSKVRVVFGRSANGMLDQADDLARKFGVVKQEALDAAAGFGLMGRAAGMSQESSAKLGSELVQLGLDMASFHDISNQEAFEKLRSGLAGEAEPLRPLGILLSEDAVKAEALAMGLVKVKRELTDQEKVLARLSLIRRQAGPAVGDLERTADSAANQMRRLEGELQNAAVEFGNKLQDALKDGISLAHELGKAIVDATGKDLATHVGEETRARINVARAAVQNPNILFRMNAGADNFRQNQEDIARLTGMPLTAAGDPRLANAQAMAAPALARSAQETAIRDARDKERSEKREANRALGNAMIEFQKDPRIEGIGAKIADGFARAKPFLQGLATGGLSGGIQAVTAPLAAAGRLTAEKKELEAKVKKLTPDNFQSQTFASGGDFARFAIEKALSSQEPDEKQVQELQDANKRLEDVNSELKRLNELVSKQKPGVILRGAS